MKVNHRFFFFLYYKAVVIDYVAATYISHIFCSAGHGKDNNFDQGRSVTSCKDAHINGWMANTVQVPMNGKLAIGAHSHQVRWAALINARAHRKQQQETAFILFGL